MIIEDYPATIRYILSTRSESRLRTSHQLPVQMQGVALPDAEVGYTEGDFGYFATQEIRRKDWVIGWQHFSMASPLILHFTTARPMVAMVCILKGKLSYDLFGHGNFMMTQGRYGFYYIPPHTENSTFLVEGGHEVVYFSFSADFLSSFVSQHAAFQELYDAQQQEEKRGQVFPVFKTGVEERRILDAMRLTNLLGPARLIFLQARIHDLLVSYFTSLEIADGSQFREESQRERFREIETFIQENYHLPLKIHFLSRKAGMNQRSFEKGFKAYFGVKAKEYIEHLRVKLATDLLKNSDMPITTIAYHVGFAGTNYFSFVFRKLQHCSPREYRQRFAEKNSNFL